MEKVNWTIRLAPPRTKKHASPQGVCLYPSCALQIPHSYFLTTSSSQGSPKYFWNEVFLHRYLIGLFLLRCPRKIRSLHGALSLDSSPGLWILCIYILLAAHRRLLEKSHLHLPGWILSITKRVYHFSHISFLLSTFLFLPWFCMSKKATLLIAGKRAYFTLALPFYLFIRNATVMNRLAKIMNFISSVLTSKLM